MNEEEAKKTLKTMKENIDKKYLKTRNSVAIETVLAELEKQQAEIEKKQDQIEYIENEYGRTIEKQSKIINLMAEQLTTDIHSKEWVIDYYEREVEK